MSLIELKPGGRGSWFFLGAPGENDSVPVPALVAAGILGLWPHHSDLRLHYHAAFFCSQIFLCSLFLRTLGITLNPSR